jgi:hypothetical protein
MFGQGASNSLPFPEPVPARLRFPELNPRVVQFF